MNHFPNRESVPTTPNYWGQLGSHELQSLGIINTTGQTHFIAGPDDRRLAVDTTGPEEGHPVILFHGKPGSRERPKPPVSVLEAVGVRLITYDRPGYGFSDPSETRPVIDSVHDVDYILDYLGVDEFSVVGRSGGGPHALACAAKLPAVRNAAALVTPAPQEIIRPEETPCGHAILKSWFATVDRVNRMKGPEGPRALLDHIRQSFAPDDHRIVRGSLEQDILASYSAAIRFGPEGWFGDYYSQIRWGFDPRDISPEVPTLVWYGGQDPFVPPAESRWLAQNIPGATEVYVPEASHFRASSEIVPAVLHWCVTGKYVAPETATK